MIYFIEYNGFVALFINESWSTDVTIIYNELIADSAFRCHPSSIPECLETVTTAIQ